MLVDVIVLGRFRPAEAGDRLETGQPHRAQLVEIAAQDRHLAAAAELDKARRANRRDRRLTATEDRQGRDVADGPVGELGADGELLPPCRCVQDHRGWRDDGALQRREIRRIVAQALRQPGPEDAVRQAVHREALAALVRETAELLRQDQAGVGVEPAGASAIDVARQLDVVGGWVLPPQAQAETPAAARQAVTAAGVASTDAEGGHYIAAETDRLCPGDGWKSGLATAEHR